MTTDETRPENPEEERGEAYQAPAMLRISGADDAEIGIAVAIVVAAAWGIGIGIGWGWGWSN
ncbi:hypothetical protein SMC26_22225 [Actinomadura fulvescens]|uniref:Uncharacterized protein n=1 Tax=Actinomadura fulvescens TaxID=46160 RepID=A0ABN3PGP9_9ACTN